MLASVLVRLVLPLRFRRIQWSALKAWSLDDRPAGTPSSHHPDRCSNILTLKSPSQKNLFPSEMHQPQTLAAN